MKVVVGIDIGGSTTKIAGFRGNEMLNPVQISANTPVAALFGGFGKFLYDNKLDLEDILQVNLTGVGSSSVNKSIYNLPTYLVDEFTANGVGGGYFANGIDEFMVVSMGTGTSYVGVKNGEPSHLGGIGIGGGTINGLSKYILGIHDIEKVRELASTGDVKKIDLRIGDISKNPLPGLDTEITASNFGKSSSSATNEDKAEGIVHMVIEDICQTAALIAQGRNIKKFVLIGALTKFTNECEVCTTMVKKLFPGIDFIIPSIGEYGTAIGAALSKKCELKEIK